MEMPFNPYLLIFNFWEKVMSSPYSKLILVVGGVFLLVVLLALVRKHIFQLSMRGAVFGFVAGIILMLLLDLVIIFGMADKTKINKLSLGENRQEATQEIFISGISNLSRVLGVSTKSAPEKKKPLTIEEAVSYYLDLSEKDAEKFKSLLCPR